MRTIGDHAVGTRNGNRFGLSPHLTAANRVNIGVPQTSDPPQTDGETNFVLPVGPAAQTPEEVDPLPLFRNRNQLELETIEGAESDSNDSVDASNQSQLKEVRRNGTLSQDSVGRQPYSAQRTSSDREVIVQRYSDGKPQIEREVVQDKNGNFVNDGFWRVLARKGEKNVIASGRYQMGVMHGVWQRQHTTESSGLFATSPFNLFESPFLSMATFDNGQLDGMWTLSDAYERKIFEIPYRKGQRHGTATWWYPAMNKMREVTFNDGLLDGHLREWDQQNKLTRDEEFVAGKKIIRNVTYYRPKQKESENFFLDAKLKVDGEDNWWDAQPAPLVTEGKRFQHGPAVAWYDNGLPKMKGQYAEGMRVGRFTWWYSNGNKQLEGSYEENKKAGPWTWWHENGMQAIAGQYESDHSRGIWRWWNKDGQLESEEDLSSQLAAPNSGDGQANTSPNSPSFKAELKIDESSRDQTGLSENPEALPEGELESIVPVELEPETDGDHQSNPADRIPALNQEDFEGANPVEIQPKNSANQDPKTLESGQLPENFFADG